MPLEKIEILFFNIEISIFPIKLFKKLYNMNSIVEINNNNYVVAESDSGQNDTFADDVTSFWAREMEQDNAETALNMQVMKNKIDDNVCLLGDKESDCEQGKESEKDNIANWEQFLSVETEMEKLDHYKNCKFQLQKQNVWSPIEIQIFKDYIADYESNHQKQIRYEEGVSLWEQFGLSKEQYDAQIVYDNACADLEDFYYNRNYEDEKDDEEIEYENSLKTIIETFETEMDQARAEQERLDDENDWWYSAEVVPLEEEEEDVSFEDWMEKRKEEVAQFECENAMDDRESF